MSARAVPGAAPAPQPAYQLITSRHICWGWALDPDQTARVLGVPAAASFADGATPAQHTNIDRVIDIFYCTNQLRADWDEADAWIHEPHAALGGRTPRDVMLAETDGLARVHRLLEQLLADKAAAGSDIREADDDQA